MIRGWNGQMSVASQLFVLDQRIMVPREQHPLRFRLEPDSPVVWFRQVPSPGIRMQVMDEIPTAHNQNSLIAQGGETHTDVKVKLRSPRFIDAQLNDRNLRGGINMLEDRPCSV